MKILSAICLLALAPLATAQVTDGSTWTDGSGTTATADVVDTAPNGGGGNVTVTDHTGFTDPLSATMSPGSTTEKPKAQDSVAGDTNSPQPNSYRVKGGKLQKKNKAGKWVDMRKVLKRKNVPKPVVRAQADDDKKGEEGGTLPGNAPPKSL